MPQLSAELFCQIILGLVSDEKHSPRHEKRKEGRVGISASIEVVPHLYTDDGHHAMRVKVRDISPSGIGFLAHIKMETGMLLQCKLPASNGNKVELVMTVRHCERVSKELFVVGASFDRPKVLPVKLPAETVAV